VVQLCLCCGQVLSFQDWLRTFARQPQVLSTVTLTGEERVITGRRICSRCLRNYSGERITMPVRNLTRGRSAIQVAQDLRRIGGSAEQPAGWAPAPETMLAQTPDGRSPDEFYP
jgi:hypothetical protein